MITRSVMSTMVQRIIPSTWHDVVCLSMGPSEHMQTFWIVLAAGLMLTWLVMVVRGPRGLNSAGALVVLGYGPVVRSLALVLALLPPLIMIYAIWVFPWRRETAMNLAGLCFAGVSLVAGLPLIEATRVQVVVTDESVTRYSPWLGEATLRWSDVESVDYSSLNAWFILSGAGMSIRVSRFLAGLDVFVQTIHRKVPPERCSASASALLSTLCSS